MTRTIVIGDIHGCIDEFRELLDKVEYCRTTDRIILLGDLIDRGPDPAAVVDWAYAIKAECVMGNHEEKALRWRKHEKRRKEDPSSYKNPMRDIDQARLEQWAKIRDSNWDWIETWPKFVHINETWTGVHAGCMPDVEIEQQLPNELMRLRYVKCIPDPNGYMKYKMAQSKPTGDPQDPENGEVILHWTKLWAGPRNIVYGHYVWDDINFTRNEFNGAETCGIDTGCVHGGYLTAKVFESRWIMEYQVRARTTYAERKPWTDE